MPEVYILNVWDSEQNKYVGIPAIKGDKGDTPVIPIASETVLGLVSPEAKTSDMTEKVGVDTSGKLWSRKIPEVPELILSVTLPERVKSATFTTDNDGNTFALKYIELEIVLPTKVSNSNSDYFWRYLDITFGDVTVPYHQDETINGLTTMAISGDVQGGVVVYIAANIAKTLTKTLTTNVSSLVVTSETTAYPDYYVPKDTKITLRGIRA